MPAPTLADILQGRYQEPAQDWWTRQAQRMPHTQGEIRDNIFRAPIAPGTETLDFDRMGSDADPTWQAWVMRNAQSMAKPPRFR